MQSEPAALPKRSDDWALTIPQRSARTGGRLVKPARYYGFLLGEGHLARRLFDGIVRRIAALPVGSPSILNFTPRVEV